MKIIKSVEACCSIHFHINYVRAVGVILNALFELFPCTVCTFKLFIRFTIYKYKLSCTYICCRTYSKWLLNLIVYRFHHKLYYHYIDINIASATSVHYLQYNFQTRKFVYWLPPIKNLLMKMILIRFIIVINQMFTCLNWDCLYYWSNSFFFGCESNQKSNTNI